MSSAFGTGLYSIAVFFGMFRGGKLDSVFGRIASAESLGMVYVRDKTSMWRPSLSSERFPLYKHCVRRVME